MLARVSRPRRLEGSVRPPGDKSISHRALILNAVAEGEAEVLGLGSGADVSSTASCLRSLGVEVEACRVRGRGLRGLRPPPGPLDCGNSGTTMRLLAGLLAAQPFQVELVGDASLSRRPMDRVVEPLRRMGAEAEAGPPLRVGGRLPLRGFVHHPSIASAQVKSALLLAGLFAEGVTAIKEAVRSRDHTERMLRAMGAPLRVRGLTVSLLGPVERLRPLSLEVPGDPSAAAFWLVAAALHGTGSVLARDVCVNPTRVGLLRVLERMGARVEVRRRRLVGGEPVADLEVGPAPELRGFSVGAEEVPELIDELPVLAVAAALARGTSRVSGAAELRVKESDRIATMAQGLAAMGAHIQELPDGWEIRGQGRLEGARVHSHGDHRVAMALGVAGLLAQGTTEVEEAGCVDVSYPGFWDQLEALCSG